MKEIDSPLTDRKSISLPDYVDILKMPDASIIKNPQKAVRHALNNPIGTPSLPEILKKSGNELNRLKVCIVISDNTRSVPHKGENGILRPVINCLLESGITCRQIIILIATGMHRSLENEDLVTMLDPRVLAGINNLAASSGVLNPPRE